MIAVTSLIFKAVVGACGTFAVPGFIFCQQEVGAEYADTFGDYVHTGFLPDKVAGNDDLVELVPCSLILVRTGEIQPMRIGIQIVESRCRWLPTDGMGR